MLGGVAEFPRPLYIVTLETLLPNVHPSDRSENPLVECGARVAWNLPSKGSTQSHLLSHAIEDSLSLEAHCA